MYPAARHRQDLVMKRRIRTYRAVCLENDYIRVMVLPELGGRIQRAYDKTNGYDFVYYNEVIKPALVGLCGPWISAAASSSTGRSITGRRRFRPWSRTICRKRGRQQAAWRCQRSGPACTAQRERCQIYAFIPDRAYLEITGQLYNRTVAAADVSVVGEPGGGGQRTHAVHFPAGCAWR